MAPSTLLEEDLSPTERYVVEDRFTTLLNPVLLAVGLLVLVMLLWSLIWVPTAL